MVTLPIALRAHLPCPQSRPCVGSGGFVCFHFHFHFHYLLYTKCLYCKFCILEVMGPAEVVVMEFDVVVKEMMRFVKKMCQLMVAVVAAAVAVADQKEEVFENSIVDDNCWNSKIVGCVVVDDGVGGDVVFPECHFVA